ncbi:unnamed protein product [Lactuca virosa]|uniref:DUF676 domain-containing protein n=1 Tax=Lactuca virosa TaxID=75947 RepID=A0AAU9LMP1_9ASTR|nr:unnamed protein product [Lactuca virosa]
MHHRTTTVFPFHHGAADVYLYAICRIPKDGDAADGLSGFFASGLVLELKKKWWDKLCRIVVENVVATPYLGSRGHGQVPMFFGVKSLEKIGYHSSVVVRRTRRHLYLKDKANGHTPLLVQMANDSEHLKFMQVFLGC